MIAFLVVIFFILYYSYAPLYRCARRYYLLRKFPHPPALPIIGHTRHFLVPAENLWEASHRLIEKYQICKIWSPTWYVMQVQNANDAQVVLMSTHNITKSPFYALFHPWFNTGLLTSTGSKWHHRRKILTPGFHFNVLREFSAIFDKEGRRMVRDILNDGIEERDLLSFVTRYTLNTICETAMGTSIAEDRGNELKYRQSVHELGRFMVHRILRPWLHWDFIFDWTKIARKQKTALNIVHSFSGKIVQNRQIYHDNTDAVHLKNEKTSRVQSSSKKQLAMLDLLIAAMRDGQIDEEGVKEEVDTFMFEGHDTVGMAIIFCLLLLAEHKDIQQLARDEVDAMLEKNNGTMNITSIQELTYLDRVIKESLRLYPSVPLISRVIDKEMPLKNRTMPAGVVVDIHIFEIHRDPNIWPDPLTFNPDRFLPENCVGRHLFSYIPFSAGLRNCIGQKFAMLELKALIGHLLHNFYFEPVDIASKVGFHLDLVLRPSTPVRMKFIPRRDRTASPK